MKKKTNKIRLIIVLFMFMFCCCAKYWLKILLFLKKIILQGLDFLMQNEETTLEILQKRQKNKFLILSIYAYNRPSYKNCVI